MYGKKKSIKSPITKGGLPKFPITMGGLRIINSTKIKIIKESMIKKLLRLTMNCFCSLQLSDSAQVTTMGDLTIINFIHWWGPLLNPFNVRDLLIDLHA